MLFTNRGREGDSRAEGGSEKVSTGRGVDEIGRCPLRSTIAGETSEKGQGMPNRKGMTRKIEDQCKHVDGKCRYSLQNAINQ